MHLLIWWLIAFVAFLAVVYGITYHYLTTRHKERMALLEAGLDPASFQLSTRPNVFVLMLGVVLIGLSLGIGVSFLIELISGYTFARLPQIYLMVLPFFTGLSLLVCYWISKRLYDRPAHTP